MSSCAGWMRPAAISSSIMAVRSGLASVPSRMAERTDGVAVRKRRPIPGAKAQGRCFWPAQRLRGAGPLAAGRSSASGKNRSAVPSVTASKSIGFATRGEMAFRCRPHRRLAASRTRVQVPLGHDRKLRPRIGERRASCATRKTSWSNRRGRIRRWPGGCRQPVRSDHRFAKRPASRASATINRFGSVTFFCQCVGVFEQSRQQVSRPRLTGGD